MPSVVRLLTSAVTTEIAHHMQWVVLWRKYHLRQIADTYKLMSVAMLSLSFFDIQEITKSFVLKPEEIT